MNHISSFFNYIKESAEELYSLFRKNCHNGGEDQLKLNEDIIEKVINTPLPFTSNEYYNFVDKYLPSGADEDLYVDGSDSFREIATEYDDLKYLNYIKTYITNPILCDMGCGIGNILHFCNKMGYKTFGYEFNKSLSKIHKKVGVDVIYGDFFTTDLSKLKTCDVVFLYRPISSGPSMNKLFKLIRSNTKDNVIIVYKYPHQMRIGGFTTISLNEWDDDLIMLFKK
jgi:2-polyprenyl-3-methyl-5-hydroxy-6-metoxy-1,4-benzoquinol methylase